MNSAAIQSLASDVAACVSTFTPTCFQNLLSKELEENVGESGEGLRIEPDTGTIIVKNTQDGVQFSMQGRMLVDDGTSHRVVVHGVRDDDMDQPGFRSIERLSANG